MLEKTLSEAEGKPGKDERREQVQYDPQRIEEKWFAFWQSQPDLYKAEPATSA